jgi:hypothetical protein
MVHSAPPAQKRQDLRPEPSLLHDAPVGRCGTGQRASLACLESMAEVCLAEIAGISRHGGDRHAEFTL